MQNISIKDVQNKILDITIKFNDFCYKHNINYCLMGGSALGCARHNGFIPWDDDLDVFMKYDDYEKFKIAIKNDPIPNLYFQKGNTEELPLFISKLRMNNTTFIERESSQRNMHKGIYIDIMVLNKAPNFFVSRFFQFYCAKILVSNSLYEYGYVTSSRLKKIIMNFSHRKIVKNGKEKYINYVIKFNRKRNFKYYTHLFGRAPYSRSFYKKEWFSSTKKMKFESTQLNMPLDYDSYLTKRYGKNYMQIPSMKTRSKYPIHAIYVDLGNDNEKN